MKETQVGCLSFSIISFSELFKGLKNLPSLEKRLFRQAGTGPRQQAGFLYLLFQLGGTVSLAENDQSHNGGDVGKRVGQLGLHHVL